MFDLNGDGFIVREEMEDIFARNSEFRAEWQNVWNQICEEADSNKDGKIDKNTQNLDIKILWSGLLTYS